MGARAGAPPSERDPREELIALVRSARARVEWARAIGATAGSREAGSLAAPATASTARLPTGAASEKAERLAALAARAHGCTLCRLHAGRTQVVFGVGNPEAELVFVGEGPGRDEDREGEPFVGRAGQLLDKIIAAMGRARAEVYICNIVKCRPPENRTPLPDESATCLPYLEEQLAILAPRAIVALGKCAAQVLLGSDEPISRMRGRFFSYRGIPVMPTFHPAYLLRNPAGKRPVWDDMQQVMKLLAEAPGAAPRPASPVGGGGGTP